VEPHIDRVTLGRPTIRTVWKIFTRGPVWPSFATNPKTPYATGHVLAESQVLWMFSGELNINVHNQLGLIPVVSSKVTKEPTKKVVC